MSEERYVVKLASGEWLTDMDKTSTLRMAYKFSREDAYRTAWMWAANGAVALRLKPSKHAAELTKLREEVELLLNERDGLKADAARDALNAKLELERVTAKLAEVKAMREEVEALRKERDASAEEVEELREWARVHQTTLNEMTAERDALAAKLAALPPDVTDEELERAVYRASTYAEAADVARRLLRGPVSVPVRPVEELRKELACVRSRHPGFVDWDAVAQRARELGAR